MQKRREKRRLKKLEVMFGDKKCDTPGFTTNISRSGMFIETKKSRFFDKEITLKLSAGEQIFTLKGEVRWRMESPAPGKKKKIIEGMGVKITEAPQDYLKWVGL